MGEMSGMCGYLAVRQVLVAVGMVDEVIKD